MPDQNEHYPGAPGSVLQDARINAGKSVVEVAEALNLLKTYVEALENNDYSRFNSPLFARGYIKSYARYMGLDEAPLLRDCDRVCRRRDEQLDRGRMSKAGAKAPAQGKIAVALIAALLVWSVSYWWLADDDEVELQVEVLPTRHAGLPELRRIPALGESLLRDNTAVDVPVAESGPSTPTHPATVSLQIRDKVWLELRDAHRRVLLSGEQPKGKVLSLAVEGPIYFSVAYWPAVTLKYNGAEVDLENMVQSNAVRLQVGER